MKKIMFNDRYGLTRAVLDGHKTMTRRSIPSEFLSITWNVSGNTLVYENAYGDFIDIRNSKFCLHNLGDIVAISHSYKDAEINPDYIVSYKKDGTPITAIQSKGWNNKMFTRAELMPHQIRITDIRVERLQGIIDDDCLKEGIEFDHNSQSYYVDYDKRSGHKTWIGSTPREAFASLIDKVLGRGTWDKNPYVIVYQFELVK